MDKIRKIVLGTLKTVMLFDLNSGVVLGIACWPITDYDALALSTAILHSYNFMWTLILLDKLSWPKLDATSILACRVRERLSTKQRGLLLLNVDPNQSFSLLFALISTTYKSWSHTASLL